VFGHDAVRGFQRPSSSVLGLDTGACYGKNLTGVWLPSGEVLHVASEKVYAKPGSAEDHSNPPPKPTPFEIDQYNMQQDPMNKWQSNTGEKAVTPIVIVQHASQSSSASKL
jgi:hypothetical protein